MTAERRRLPNRRFASSFELEVSRIAEQEGER
jgi:hypothetical protein